MILDVIFVNHYAHISSRCLIHTKYKIFKRGIFYRITLLRNGKIVCGYDLYEQRVLRRTEALGRRKRMS